MSKNFNVHEMFYAYFGLKFSLEARNACCAFVSGVVTITFGCTEDLENVYHEGNQTQSKHQCKRNPITEMEIRSFSFFPLLSRKLNRIPPPFCFFFFFLLH